MLVSGRKNKALPFIEFGGSQFMPKHVWWSMITHYVIFSLLPHIATWVHFMNCSGKLLNIIIPIVDEISITWTNVIEISFWYHLIPMHISVLAIGQVVLATLPRDSQQMLAMAPWPQRVVMVVLYVKQWCQLSAQANFGFVMLLDLFCLQSIGLIVCGWTRIKRNYGATFTNNAFCGDYIMHTSI